VFVVTALGQEKLCTCDLPVTIVRLLGSGVSTELQEAALDLLANLAENGQFYRGHIVILGVEIVCMQWKRFGVRNLNGTMFCSSKIVSLIHVYTLLLHVVVVVFVVVAILFVDSYPLSLFV